MARCSFAQWRPLPANRTEPSIRPTQIIDHSIVGSATAAESWFKVSPYESHFIVRLDGTIWQLMDTEKSADANYRANRRPDGTGAISIETEDNGNPDSFPWTAPQLTSLMRLHNWAADTHRIPRRQCRTPSDPGLGYHTLHPYDWTNVRGKTCPGRVRIAQYKTILLPAFISGVVTGLSLGDRVLGRGDAGDDVREWQQLLVDRFGLELAVDGDFGPATEAATKHIQSFVGVESDGLVGPATLKAVRAWKPVPLHDWEVTVRYRSDADGCAADMLGKAFSFKVLPETDRARDLIRITVGYPGGEFAVVGTDPEDTKMRAIARIRDPQWGADIRNLGRRRAGRV